MKEKLTIAWLYPDLMSTYGDRGNIFVLKKRCEWRGIDVEVRSITLETSIAQLKSCDLVFMGGAQDRQQKIVSEDLIPQKGPVVKEMIEAGIPALFVCAAYQFVGKYYKPYEGDPIPGAGIWDLSTEHPGDHAKRLIGNTVATIMNPQELSGQTIVGFENHGGYTTLGPSMRPLAKVVRGGGNNGADGYEGATYKNTLGSYFHGPMLPKNPIIADWLIKKALEVKYGKEIELNQLDDSLSAKARNFLISRT